MRKAIYLYKSGSLIRSSNNLIFETNEEKIYLPIFQIDTINVFNHINLNKNTIILLNNYDILVNFFDYNGNYKGTYYPYYPIKGEYLKKQVLFLNDNNQKINLAKKIIQASMINMMALVKYYHKKNLFFTSELNKMKRMLSEFNRIDINNTTIDNLMIHEAKFKQLYYSCFTKITKNKDFSFIERSTRPPKDPINAIMSYGYSLLYTLIANALFRSRLHISLPIIHSNIRREEGLQYDIADIFKPVVVDRLFFRLINKNQISINHFDKTDKGVYLNKEGAQIFIEEFEGLLKNTISLSSSKRKLSYRSIISAEIHKISNHIFLNKEYNSFKMKW